MQQGRPLAYLSKSLSSRNRGLSVYEKELLAIVFAVTKWEHYLLGRHFIINTDHQSLKYLLEQRLATTCQFRWLSKLMGLDYEICYKKGKENLAADALSRVPSAQLLSMAVSKVHPTLFDDIKRGRVYMIYLVFMKLFGIIEYFIYLVFMKLFSIIEYFIVFHFFLIICIINFD